MTTSNHAELLRIESVTKSFRRGFRASDSRVLSGVSLSLHQGETVAISGANGAGKSTLLRICAHLLLPDAGCVTLGGAPLCSNTRARVGFCSGDERSFFLRLTARTNLRFYARLFGVPSRMAEQTINRLANKLGVEPWLDRPVAESSSGIRARLGLLRALVHGPELLLLDEPTKSQDERGRNLICDAISDHSIGKNGAMLVSHDGRVVEALGARSILLTDGRLDLRERC